MNAAARIETARLVLRPPGAGDRGFLAGLIGDPVVRRYLGGPVGGAAVVNGYMAPVAGAVWLVSAATGPVGVISVSPHKDGADWELSYQFAPTSWGRGHATEAGRAVLGAARRAGLARIIAETQVANGASRALLGRLGFREMRRVDRFGAAQVICGRDL